MEEEDVTIAAGQQEIQQLRRQLREKIFEFIEDERKEKDSGILRLIDHIRELELQLSKKNELHAKQWQRPEVEQKASSALS